jgi:thiosulfate dehydrogenase
MVMTAPMTCRFILSRAALAGALVAVAVLVGPAGAHKDPVTPQQLTAYQEAFMEQVRKGDLLFHGDAATEKAMDVVLSRTGMACAMCHPMTADTPTRSRSTRRIRPSS